MTCCVSSSSRRAGAGLALGLAVGLAGCEGGNRAAVWPGHADAKEPVRIALLPAEDLSGTAAPLRDVEQTAQLALGRVGIDVVGGAAVDEFLARHRLRNTGGVDRETARSAREELG